MDFREEIRVYEEQPISKQILFHILRDYKRPHDKIVELVKTKELTPLKRGWYLPGPNLKMPKPEPFLIANHLWGPSYVSIESALSYWGFIPERVYGVTSVTLKKTTDFETHAGRFSYTHLSLPYYSYGITYVQLTAKQVALVATPEKAVCDKIITTSGVILRSTIQVKNFLMDDLRIEEENLARLNHSLISEWVEKAPKKESISWLIKTLERL